MKIVIIGGVAAGMGVATKLKRIDKDNEVLVIERGEHVSYANCGLPYFIEGVISKAEKLTLFTPEFFKKRYNIDVLINTEAKSIDKDKKTVLLDNGESVSYDKLVITTGGNPIKPDLKGVDNDNIFTLWTIPDALKIDEFIKNKNPKTACVIGGGFIGIEMAEALKERGLKVSVIEKSAHIMPPADFEYAKLITDTLIGNGIDVLTDEEVVSFLKDNVNLKSGKSVSADMIILSIGVSPNNQLAKQSGMELEKSGAIAVNEYFETSIKDIYACGDVIEVNHVDGFRLKIPLAGLARKQSRLLALNLTGIKSPYKETTSPSVIKVFDYTYSSVGLSYEFLQRMNVQDLKFISVSDAIHPSYYPDAHNLTVSLVYNKKTRKILGAQAFGKKDVEKRIDAISVAMFLKADIDQLQHIDFAYAPPYNNPIDHVNYLSMVGQNDLQLPQIDFSQFIKSFDSNTDILIDIRTEKERSEDGFIKNSIHIPVDELDSNIEKIPKDKNIFVHCKSGKRSYLSQTKLLKHFKNVTNISGGFTLMSLSKNFENFKG